MWLVLALIARVDLHLLIARLNLFLVSHTYSRIVTVLAQCNYVSSPNLGDDTLPVASISLLERGAT